MASSRSFYRSQLLFFLTVIFQTPFAHAGISVKGSATWSLGTHSSAQQTVQSRAVNTAAVYVLPGYRVDMGLGSLLIGPTGQFQITGQNTTPSTVGNTNTRGTGLTFGVGGNLDFGPFNATLGVELLGSYQLTATTTSGATLAYGSPLGGRAAFGYTVLPGLSVEAAFSLTQFGSAKVDTSTTDLGTDKFQAMTYGLGLSYQL